MSVKKRCPLFLKKSVCRYHFCVAQNSSWKSKMAAAASTWRLGVAKSWRPRVKRHSGSDSDIIVSKSVTDLTTGGDVGNLVPGGDPWRWLPEGFPHEGDCFFFVSNRFSLFLKKFFYRCHFCVCHNKARIRFSLDRFRWIYIYICIY